MAAYIVCITGGVASGKSAVARCFEQLGRSVIDADVLARELVQPGQPALAAIQTRFGASVMQADGQLDRAALRALVFAEPQSRRDLEAILHPLIRRELQRLALAAPGLYALVAVPLLAEGGGRSSYPWLSRVLVVDAPVSSQQQRLMQRDGSDADLARRMLAAQASRRQRLALADDVIVNDGTLVHLAAAVAGLDERYRDAAAG